MGIFDFLRPKKRQTGQYSKVNELGSYQSIFSAFGRDIYNSDLVRSCIRPLADHTAKANAICSDKRIERLLKSPNKFMSGYDFLAKVRTKLELYNTAFIYIQRDDRLNVIGFYPVPYSDFEAVEYNNNLYIKFGFSGSQSKTYVLPWEDLAVLRKDYNSSDIAGDTNDPIRSTLSIIHTLDEGISNAVKSTSNLRGIVKSNVSMLAPEDLKASKERFVADYMTLENEGGIAALDSTLDFIPVNMNPTVTTWEHRGQLRDDVYRYFGVSEKIVTSNYTEDEMEAFYSSRIEPFLVALSLELTRKVFSEREIAFGREIIFESNRLQFASAKTKLELREMIDRGAMVPDEWRAAFNMAPIPGGDKPIRRLDTAEVDVGNKDKTENDDEEDEDEKD